VFFPSVFAFQRTGNDSVSLLFFAVGIRGEPERLAFGVQASPGLKLSPVRGFPGVRHLEGAGGAV